MALSRQWRAKIIVRGRGKKADQGHAVIVGNVPVDQLKIARLQRNIEAERDGSTKGGEDRSGISLH